MYKLDPITGALIDAGAAGGGIGGTTGTTDNAITRANGTGGSTLQGSLATIDDTGGGVFPGNCQFAGTLFCFSSVVFVQKNTLLQNNSTLGFASDAGAGDAFIVRDAANTLALRNGANAQTLNVYNTFTDAGDYARLAVTTVGTTVDIYVQEAGSGVGAITAIRFNKKLNLTNVPTSSSGLSSGDVWSNLGILTIVA